MRILVIQLKQIGDVLLSLPVCNSLRKTYPEAVIDYIIYDYTEGVVKGNPNINNIIKVTAKERKNKIEYIKFIYRLKKNKYDIVVNIQGKLEGAMITLLTGAKKRIGFNRKGWKIFHNVIIDEEKEMVVTGIGNTVDGRLSLLKGIGEKINYDYNYNIYLSDEEIKSMHQRMEKGGINFSKPIFAFGITSRKDYRVWNIEYYKKVIEHLIEKYNAQIILFFAPNEKEYIMKGYELVNKPQNIFINIETKSVRDLLALMKNCDMYIGNDNGPRHFAQGLEIPAYSIFSPKAIKKNFNPHNNCKYVAVDLQDVLELNDDEYIKVKNKINNENYFDYFNKITPEFVIKQIEKMIEDNKVIERSRGERD